MALASNVAVTITKLIAGVITGSSALLSEGAHSVADTLNELFLVASVRRSERPADEQHPFGYGAERFFWSLIAAVGIFVAGGGFSFFQAYAAFRGPAHTGHWILTYAVLGAAGLFEGASFIRATYQIRREATAAHRGPVSHVLKSTDPAMKTVASEDGIALVGLLLAGLGVALHQVTGAELWEGIASALIGVLLVCAAIFLARDNMSLLIGRSVESDLRQAIGETVRGHPKVENVVELLTRYLGADEVLVAARVELVDGLTSDGIEEMSSEIDAQLRDLSAQVTQVFIDATTSAERRRLEEAGRIGAAGENVGLDPS
ncbi:MAG: cation diffusion facilitator family transporter [Acidimicrobiaceae bacterium]|nr:cation diffusion facilitator family transporter [Acidimicrobiaceae bacterium]